MGELGRGFFRRLATELHLFQKEMEMERPWPVGILESFLVRDGGWKARQGVFPATCNREVSLDQKEVETERPWPVGILESSSRGRRLES